MICGIHHGVEDLNRALLTAQFPQKMWQISTQTCLGSVFRSILPFTIKLGKHNCCPNLQVWHVTGSNWFPIQTSSFHGWGHQVLAFTTPNGPKWRILIVVGSCLIDIYHQATHYQHSQASTARVIIACDHYSLPSMNAHS